MPQAIPIAAYYAGYALGGSAWATAAMFAATVVVNNYQNRKAAQRARDEANRNARDRELMIRSAIAPHRVVYGRDKVSGPIVYMQSTGDKGQYLHVVVALAAHECDAIEAVFLNEIALTLDEDGFATNTEFVSPDRTEYATHTGTTSGTGRLTLPHNALTIESAYKEHGVGDASSQEHFTDITHVSGTAVVDDLPTNTEVTVNYTYTLEGTPRVRVKMHLGVDGQAADADLIAESGGQWTIAHTGTGICYVYARFEYDTDIFGSTGLPNISALVRGKKVWDPVSSTEVWSNNAALIVADWLKAGEGFKATTDEVPDDELIEARNICEELVDLYHSGAMSFTANSTTVVGSGTEWLSYASPGLIFTGPDAVVYTILRVTDDTHLELTEPYGGSTVGGYTYMLQQHRYTCDSSFTSDQSPLDVLGSILGCMAGRCVWSQGRWLIRPGAYRTPVLTITSDMLVGQRTVVTRANRSELFNAVRVTFRDAAQRFAEVQAPLVVNAGYETEDGGVRIVREINVQSLADKYRAQRLGKIELERSRQAVAIRFNTTLAAYDLAPTDTFMLELPWYGWTAKVFEVLERVFSGDGLIQYTARETAAGVWDWNFGEATVGDLAPNTNLPNPYAQPAALTGLTINQYSRVMNDGTIMLLARLSWTASADVFVRSGGHIEVEWARSDILVISSIRRTGTDTYAELSPLIGEFGYVTRVRQVNAVGKASNWAYKSFIAGVDTEPPENVSGLDWGIKPGLVRITCDPCVALDYAETELRYMYSAPASEDDWDTATFLVRGKSNEYHHPRPPNGTYYVLAKHIDTSGNYSVNLAYITVVVDDSIDFLTSGTLTLTTDRFPFFSFADGTTHTPQPPGDADINITAALVNLVGTPTFSALAFNASSVSLGSVALSGSGLTRTLTAAAFVAPGTNGSVRYVVVSATLAGASDSLTVYRQDSTTTEARIYLSNPTHTIATDANGEGGDYSGAFTMVEVYEGLTATTSSWTFTITPDAGVTATINGGAGPVSGTGLITVAVTAMTVPDGAVLITASRATYADLTATFYVTKNESTGDYSVYWDPRSEIILPVGADGQVSSYADAFSSLIILLAGGVSDVANWTFTKVDTNVTSTLTGNRVDVTGVIELGTVGTVVNTDITSSMPSGWTRPSKVIWTGSGWVGLGYHAGTPFDTVQTSSDFSTWITRSVGVSALWTDGAAGNGVVIAVSMAAVDNDLVRSSDGGVTWTADTYGSAMQVNFVGWLGSHFILTQVGGTGGRISTDGDTWTEITMPGSSCRVWGSTGRWLAEDSSGSLYYSTNNGTSWTACSGLPATFTSYGASMYRGRFVMLRNTGSSSSTFYFSDSGGAAWASGTLAQPINGVGFFGIVKGVLYLIGGDGKVQYTTDGKSWRWAGTTTTSALSGAAFDGQNSVDLPISILPGITTTSPYRYYTHPLLSTSETEGFVTVTASKPGEMDIVRSLPVRRGVVEVGGRVFAAQPYGLVLPATSDGVVTDYSGATITARAEYNGADESALWSWTYTTTYLTPSSGSTNSITITAMDSAQDVGTVTFTATRAGFASVSGTLLVRKAKGSEGSGPRIGAAYSVVEASNTLIGVRFNTDGSVDVRRGSSGSYTRLTQWAGAVAAGVGNGYWLYIAPRAGSHSLTTGTTDTWLALSSARTFEMSDATSGNHLFEADVYIGTSSSGANAVAGYFSLRLLVP